jgi:hypothetical protein
MKTKDTVCIVNSAGEAHMISSEQHRKAAGQSFGSREWPGLDAGARAKLVAAAVPWQCGSDIPVAPARGPMQTYTPRETVVTDAGAHVSRRSGYMGRDGARVADVWDQMEVAAYRSYQRLLADAKKKKKPKDKWPVYSAPFTPGQVAAARGYLALKESVTGSAMKCSLAGMTGGGGSGMVDREAARLRDIRRLRMLERRIGSRFAKTPQRPSQEEGKRRSITVRRLVDLVAIDGWDLSMVLERHGWSKTGKNRKALQTQLAAALDRMQGYDLDEPQ